VVPAASAAISGLAISGLSTSRFTFEGFLSTSKKQRSEHLQSLVKDRHTLIFYEAPHKLIQTLNDMKNAFGDRKVSLCREITKLHEEVIRTTFSEALELYTEKIPKGEYVLVVEGAAEELPSEFTIEEAVFQVQKLISDGAKPTDACKEIAKNSGFKKSELYEKIKQN
ncbi:MAG: SAM-dependent methyltransferase, partial [Oscillospiraceae bacterium]